MKTNKKYVMPLMVILGIGLVVAGLATYIGNPVQADVTVSSPMQQWISEDGESTWDEDNSISFTDVLGGESITFSIKDKNLADARITGVAENSVTNTLGVSCADFESVEITTITTINGIWQSTSPGELIAAGLCVDVEAEIESEESVVFMWGPNAPVDNEMTWEIGQIDISEIVVTFEEAAEGSYTFTSNILPELPA